MGRLLILLLSLELMWTWVMNVKRALGLPVGFAFSDEFGIAPEFLLAWLPVAVNGGMALLILWALWRFWGVLGRLGGGECVPFSWNWACACLVLGAFVVPSWLAWYGAAMAALAGRWTVSLYDWRYFAVACCQSLLGFSLLGALWRQWRLLRDGAAKEVLEE